MKKRCVFIILNLFLILLFIGGVKSENKETINPFADIPINSAERIELSDLTITSSENELGRSKMVTKEIDIQNIGKYLKTISCAESNQKEKEPDFEISLIDNTEKEKNYIYSIGISKNQIYVYKYNNEDTNKFIYNYTDTKVLEELSKLYNDMKYKEDFLMKK